MYTVRQAAIKTVIDIMPHLVVIGLTSLGETTARDASVTGQVVPPLEHEASVSSCGARTLFTRTASTGVVIGRTEPAAAVRRRLHTGVARRTVFSLTSNRQGHRSREVTATELRLDPLVCLVSLETTQTQAHAH